MQGNGIVQDVLKSFGAPGEVTIYAQKEVWGKRYELVLLADQEGAEKIMKGKSIRFEGTFAGLTFETLRFEKVKVKKVSGFAWLGGLWPF